MWSFPMKGKLHLFNREFVKRSDLNVPFENKQSLKTMPDRVSKYKLSFSQHSGLGILKHAGMHKKRIVGKQKNNNKKHNSIKFKV